MVLDSSGPTTHRQMSFFITGLFAHQVAFPLLRACRLYSRICMSEAKDHGQRVSAPSLSIARNRYSIKTHCLQDTTQRHSIDGPTDQCIAHPVMHGRKHIKRQPEQALRDKFS